MRNWAALHDTLADLRDIERAPWTERGELEEFVSTLCGRAADDIGALMEWIDNLREKLRRRNKKRSKPLARFCEGWNQ